MHRYWSALIGLILILIDLPGSAGGQTYTLISDTAITGSAAVNPVVGGNIGLLANWGGVYAPEQDISGGIWSIVAGILTPSGTGDYRSDWALRPALEDMTNGRIVGYTVPCATPTDTFVLLLRANRTNKTAYSVWFQTGTGLSIHSLSVTGFGAGTQTPFTATPGHSYIVTCSAVPGTTGGTTTVIASLADQAAPNAVLATCTLANDTTATVQGAGSAGVADYTGSSKWTRLATYTYAPPITFSVTPAMAVPSTPLVVTVTGSNTNWTAATTFAVAGGAGASIANLSVNTTTQVATFTLNPGTALGTLTISDSTDAATASLLVAPPSPLVAGMPGVPVSGPTSLRFVVPAPTGGVGPYTATVYRTSPAVAGFVPPATGTAMGTFAALPFTFTDSSPGTTLNSYKVIYTDSTVPTPLTAISEPVFGKVTSGPSLVIGFIGDSFDVQAPGFEPAPTTCGNLIAAWTGRAVTVVNQGASGTTSGNWQPGSPLYNNARTAFAAAGVTHILIRLGLNDAYNTILTPAATYQANMQNIVTQLHTDFPGVPIQLDYHSTPAPDAWKALGGIYWPENLSLALLLQYQSRLNTIIATTPNTYLGDTKSWQFFAQHTDLLSDQLHPGSDGMFYLAEFDAQAFMGNFCPGFMSGGTKRKVQ